MCRGTAGPSATWNKFSGCSLLSLPWGDKDQAAYDRACERAEILVTVHGSDELNRILDLLIYDKRKSGFAGRVLTSDMPEFLLNKNDRLEPAAPYFDIAAVDTWATFPLRLVFWRTSMQGMVKRRSPLFHPETYFTMACLAVDELHTMHLGVFAHFVAYSFWRILEADLWGIGAGTTESVMHMISFGHLRQQLSLWYKSAAAKIDGLRVYEVPSSFDLVCIGPHAKPGMNTKAAETGTLLRFIAFFEG